MTETEAFNKIFEGGAIALPFLIKFTHPTAGTLRFINNTESVTYDGELYTAASFKYTPPDANGESAELSIDGINTGLIEFVENADSDYSLSIVGILLEGQGDNVHSVQPIRCYRHFYGSVSYTESMQLDFKLGADNRLDMIFNPYTFDTDNNRANA